MRSFYSTSVFARFSPKSLLTVGVVLNEMDNDERRAAYNCDITYVTNNELGFDYLRDNMVIYKEQLVQRGLHYAVIDEVDSVLIEKIKELAENDDRNFSQYINLVLKKNIEKNN